MARPRKTPAATPATEAPTPAATPATVRMVRDLPEGARGNRTADVHPDEIENWKRAGWRIEE